MIAREYEWELMPLAIDQQVGTVVWSPLSGGRLSGKVGRNRPAPQGSRMATLGAHGPELPLEQFYAVIDVLRDIAGDLGRSVSQVALTGCCSARPFRPWSSARAMQRSCATTSVFSNSPSHQSKCNASTKPAQRHRSTRTGTSGRRSPSATRRQPPERLLAQAIPVNRCGAVRAAARRKRDGVTPMWSRKKREKLPGVENPRSNATEVKGSSS